MMDLKKPLSSFDELEARLQNQYGTSKDLVASKLKPFFGAGQLPTIKFYEEDNLDWGGRDIIIRGEFLGVGLAWLTDQLVSLGGDDWQVHLPEELRHLLDDIRLKEAGVRLWLGNDGLELASFDFQLEFRCPAWNLLDKSLSIALNRVHFFINNPLETADSRMVWASFEGTLTVLDLPFTVTIQVPEFSISAVHRAEKPLDVVKSAMGTLPAPPQAPFNRIELHAVPGSFYTFLLDANVPVEWTLKDGNAAFLHVTASLYSSVSQTASAKSSGFPLPITSWQFQAEAAEESAEGFPIQALLERLAAEVQGLPPLSAPSSINGFSVLGFSLSYDVPTKDFKLSASGLLPLGDGQKLRAQLDVEIVHQQDGTYQNHFGGILTFETDGGESLEFDVVFEKSAEAKTFLSLYRDLSGIPLAVRSLVNPISPELAKAIPESLKLTLKQAFYAYTVKDEKPKHLFGLEIDGGINLSDIKLPDLPLVGGSLLPPEERLELAFRILAASDTFKQDEISALESLVNQGLGLPSGEISKFAVQTSLKFGSEIRQLNLPVGATQNGLANSKDLGPTDAQPTKAPAQVTPVKADDVQWLSIQKTFGPVHFERLGLKVDGGNIRAMLDASLSVSALTIALDGLTMSSPLNDFHPEFSLHGMSIDFSSDELEIGGSFLRQELERKIAGMDKPQSYVTYGGTAVIRTSKLTLSAIGSYTLLSGHPSLFIYALLNYPIGGPAFFFVTGLAAGFGFNRALAMPGIDEIKTFPLVEEARRGDAPNLTGAAERQNALVNELAALESFIPAEIGKYFLAVGIHFTSFKIVDSFALLAVQFGRRVEIDLLGISVLTAPSGLEANATPVARAELAIKARYVPDEGFLSVLGKLTSDSYILSKECHLQGGFAFYSWFANEHAGDFVLTLGGYHPRFQPPAHYPQVPRVGVRWQVSDAITIKGDCYFALTPHAIMAGGNLEATWQEGPLRAWFKAGLDFLLKWQPYYYDARIYVSIGASYTLEAFGNSTISAELGADLHVWGPEFALTADVDFHVFSVHIEFLPSHQAAKAVTWPDFEKAFLPASHQVCTISVLSGLLHQTGSGKDARPIVDMKAPAFVVNTTIPVNRVQFGNTNGHPHPRNELKFLGADRPMYFADKDLTQAQPFKFENERTQDAPVQSETKFSKKLGTPGVQPMKVAPENFDSLLKIRVKRIVDKNESDVEHEFTFTPILKSVPAALWGSPDNAPADNPNPKATLVADTFTGFELYSAVQPAPGASHEIAADKLRYDATEFEHTIRWEDSSVEWINNPDAQARLDTTAGANTTSVQRDALLKELGITAYRFDFSHKPSLGMVYPPDLEELSA